jgi:hypothetical protein
VSKILDSGGYCALDYNFFFNCLFFLVLNSAHVNHLAPNADSIIAAHPEKAPAAVTSAIAEHRHQKVDIPKYVGSTIASLLVFVMAATMRGK